MKKIPQYHDRVFIKTCHIEVPHPKLLDDQVFHLEKVQIFKGKEQGLILNGVFCTQIVQDDEKPLLEFFLPGDTVVTADVIAKRAWHDGKLQWQEAVIVSGD